MITDIRMDLRFKLYYAGSCPQFSLALASDYDGAKVRGRAEIIRWRRPDSKLKPLTV